MRTRLGIALIGLCAATAASASTLTATRNYPAEGIESIRIDFAAGSLDVIATDSDQIEVTMIARCRSERCNERARGLRLLSENEDGTLVFRLEGQRKSSPGRPKVSLEFRVPRALGLSVHMGAGSAEIDGLRGNVSLKMGAGDVEIRRSERSVRTVDVNVGVGDASLRVGPQRVCGRGFVSKRIRWDEGAGLGRVDVDLGAGDVTVALK